MRNSLVLIAALCCEMVFPTFAKTFLQERVVGAISLAASTSSGILSVASRGQPGSAHSSLTVDDQEQEWSGESIAAEGQIASVIFRSPDAWKQVLWIDMGSEITSCRQKAPIKKNSPVLIGGSVIGVVDYVGSHRSRVRLITDSELHLSVSVVQGKAYREYLLEAIHRLVCALTYGTEGVTGDRAMTLYEQLKRWEEQLSGGESRGETLWLVHGELSGGSSASWREPAILHGTGFCSPEGSALGRVPMKVGDLLVTSGMDGIFPRGLFVGEISYLAPLKEGDAYYSLEAWPTAPSMANAVLVRVLPPVG